MLEARTHGDLESRVESDMTKEEILHHTFQLIVTTREIQSWVAQTFDEASLVLVTKQTNDERLRRGIGDPMGPVDQQTGDQIDRQAIGQEVHGENSKSRRSDVNQGDLNNYRAVTKNSPPWRYKSFRSWMEISAVITRGGGSTPAVTNCSMKCSCSTSVQPKMKTRLCSAQ